MKKLFSVIILTICALSLSFGQSIEGSWNGLLDVGQQKLRLVVHITKQDSIYVGKMDSPDQGATGFPISTVKFDDPDLSFEISQLAVVYNGTMQGDTLIVGIFTQGKVSSILSLTKSEIVINRPQEPKPPYPYRSENIRFPGKSPDVTLAGTLTMPQGKGKYPAVILVSGSGAQNRDEELFNHKPFLVISDYLTRNGVAVLRYDDRGFGESTGNSATGTTADFTDDALGAFEYLASRPEIDHNKIGIMGHSEGGIIVFMAAAQQPKIGFIVSLAGTGIQGDSILHRQVRDLSHAAGYSENVVETYCNAIRSCMDTANSHSEDYIRENLTKIYSDIYIQQDLKTSLPEELQKGLFQNLKMFASPWMRYFLSLDPAPYIATVKCPVLAVNGSKDLQVNSKINLEAIRKSLEAGGNRDYTIREYDGLNHLFQTATTGQMSEYGQIEETFSPEVLSDIKDWILKRR